MSNQYFETMQSLGGVLKIKDVPLATDSWTSITKEGYVTFMVHFVEP